MISFGFEEEVARKALQASVSNLFTDLEFQRFLLEIVFRLIYAIMIPTNGLFYYLQGGDIEKATEWIFNPPSGMSNMDTTPSSSGNVVDAAMSDGQGS